MITKKNKPNKMRTPDPIKNPLLRLFILGTSSGLGLGYAPVAPGTFGSVLGLVFGFWLLMYPTWISMLICAAFLWIFTIIADRAARHWGNMDDGRVVIDEVLGMGITMIGLRNVANAQAQSAGMASGIHWLFSNPELIVVAFIVFRLLDILKPFPARMFDRKPSGFGIMADDTVSGLYGAVVIYGIAKIWLN